MIKYFRKNLLSLQNHACITIGPVNVSSSPLAFIKIVLGL